jgi:hypothetical protein
MIAAIGFDDITERGEGFFGQRLDNQFAHAGSSFSKFVNENTAIFVLIVPTLCVVTHPWTLCVRS